MREASGSLKAIGGWVAEQPLYTARQVRALDQAAVGAGIPGQVLMERAGEALLHVLCSQWPDWRRLHLAVVAGPGNNGGDGYVLARFLRELGGSATLLTVGDHSRLRGEAAEAACRWQRAGGEVSEANEASLSAGYNLFVDALLGTGLDRPVGSPFREVLEAIERLSVPVLAVDIPSGLSADTGRVFGTALSATATVTFGGLKRGLVTANGPDYTGQVWIEGLGIPEESREEVPASGRLLTAGSLSLRSRPRNSHKGHFGHVVIIGGSPGMAGAAAMAGWSAFRAGCGRVTCCVTPETRTTVAGFYPELMTSVWGEGQSLPEGLFETASSLAIGPGLGQSPEARATLGQACECDCPLVIDADGLNGLAQEPDLAERVRQRTTPTVLTPHPGEASRLLGLTVSEVEADRFAGAARLADSFNAICCLKGVGTIVAQPQGYYAVNTTGNPGMSIAGQGDILTGVIAAQLAQGRLAYESACLGVWAHGAVGDRLARTRGPFGFSATECADSLPEIWRELIAPSS